MNMLNNIEKNHVRNSGLTLVSAIVSLLVGIVISVGMVIPLVNGIIEEQNFTGTTATILSIIPVFIGLVPLIITASFFNA